MAARSFLQGAGRDASTGAVSGAALRWALISTTALLTMIGAAEARAADAVAAVSHPPVPTVSEKAQPATVAQPVLSHPQSVGAEVSSADVEGTEVADLRAEIARLRRERDEALQAKVQMKDRWASAEEKAMAASNALAAMERELKVHKAEVARLSDRVAKGSTELAGLHSDLARLQGDLRSTEARALALAQQRGLLVLRLARSEIGSIRERQQQDRLFLQLAARTQTSVTAIESLLESTGLDVDRLVKLVPADKNGGQGGPFVPLETGLKQAANPSSVAVSLVAPRIEERLDRWHAIAKLLRVLPFGSPVDEISVTSGFGGRRDPFAGKAAFHEGVDFDGAPRTPIHAAAAGTVVFAGRQRGYGNVIEIDHGYGIQTRYAHLRSLDVEEGDQVDAGQLIGRMGSTGRSTGTHLHYEVRLDGRPTNPLSYVEFGQILQAARK